MRLRGWIGVGVALILGACGGNGVGKNSKVDSTNGISDSLKTNATEQIRDIATQQTRDMATEQNQDETTVYVDTMSTYNLNVYKPRFSRIDLVCGERPSQENDSVIMVIAGAFTRKLLTEFSHDNIIGSHTAGGVFYQDAENKRLTGTFVFDNGESSFHYKSNHDSLLKSAASHGGSGFMQEMLIHKGQVVSHTRPDKNENQFRALCLLDGEVVVVESNRSVPFGLFIKAMTKLGVQDALYTDMGEGWNYSWYRKPDGSIEELHSIRSPFSTNWVTFYK